MNEQTPNVVGFTLEDAMQRLQDSSAVVVVQTISSRAGVLHADCKRVIRQSAQQDGRILLSVSDFVCQIEGEYSDYE